MIVALIQNPSPSETWAKGARNQATAGGYAQGSARRYAVGDFPSNVSGSEKILGSDRRAARDKIRPIPFPKPWRENQ